MQRQNLPKRFNENSGVYHLVEGGKLRKGIHVERWVAAGHAENKVLIRE